MTHTYAKGQSQKSTVRVETDGRTEAVALLLVLTRSIIAGNLLSVADFVGLKPTKATTSATFTVSVYRHSAMRWYTQFSNEAAFPSLRGKHIYR